MLDQNRHKVLMLQIMKDIYSDLELANSLGFKGGSALMFFYDLPRFSVDLDFNLLNDSKLEDVYDNIRKILRKYGEIKDEALKHFSLIAVLNYMDKQRNLKVEVSKRKFQDRYEIKNFLGIKMRVMKEADMFAHKLCALCDRNTPAGRDVFDCWFFMNKRTCINNKIVETRSGMSLDKYIEQCVKTVRSMTASYIMGGLGELIDNELKQFVRNKIIDETVSLFRIYQAYPLIDNVS